MKLFVYKLTWKTFLITFKENPLEFLVEQNVKVTSNEQKVTSNKQKATSKEQEVTSNEVKITNKKQKLRSKQETSKKLHLAFQVHSFFGRMKKVLPGLFLLPIAAIISCAPRHVVLEEELSIHQIFH